MDGRIPSAVEEPAAEARKIEQLFDLILAVVVVGALYFAREVLIPITLAVLLAFVLAPLVQLLRRLKVPRVAAVLIAAALSLSAILAMGALIGSQVAALAREAPKYAGTIEAKLHAIGSLTTTRLTALTNGLGPALAKAANPAGPAQGGPLPFSATPAPLPVEIHQPAPNPLALARRVIGPVLAPIGTTGLVLVVAVFILLQQADLRDRLIRLLGSSDLHRTTGAMDDAAARLSRYFLSQLAVNAGFGAVVGTGLYFIGVPHSILWAALAALLRFIPYLGGVISAALPAALAAAVDPGWAMVLWTLALFVVAEAFTGQVVEPFLYGHSTGLSPVSVVVAAIFWSWLWGPIGLILSTPLSLCLLVLGRHVPRLALIEVLLGDRPPLTPVESFYQRVLAGDADEVLEQAESLLRAGSLSAYYDEVAMPGLQLAAADLQRGVLKPQQLGHIRDAVVDVVTVLASHVDEQTAASGEAPAGPVAEEKPVSGAAPRTLNTASQPGQDRPLVLCVSAHGALDDAACIILAQLLEKHGFRVRSAPPEALSRARLSELDGGDFFAVCMSHFIVGESQTRLRYLIRTLGRQMPQTPLIVGLWRPASDARGAPVLEDAAVSAWVNTLREAVDACVALADPDAGQPAATGRTPSYGQA